MGGAGFCQLAATDEVGTSEGSVTNIRVSLLSAKVKSLPSLRQDCVFPASSSILDVVVFSYKVV